jgi:hypothetical protein
MSRILIGFAVFVVCVLLLAKGCAPGCMSKPYIGQADSLCEVNPFVR